MLLVLVNFAHLVSLTEGSKLVLITCHVCCVSPLTSLGSRIWCREVDTIGDQSEIDPSELVSLLVRLLFIIFSFKVPVGSRIAGILERNDFITIPVGVEFQQAF